MFKITKKMISLLLCMAMVLSMVPAVFAADSMMILRNTPSSASVEVGDTVTFTVTCTGSFLTAGQFVLNIPYGMSYVAESASIPENLRAELGLAGAVDWTEEILMWSFYNDVPVNIPADTVLLTYECTVDREGTHQITMSEALGFDVDFMELDAYVVQEVVSTDVTAESTLTIRNTPDAAVVNVGDTVTYTVTCTGSLLTAAQFTLNIPEGMSYVAESATIPKNLEAQLGLNGGTDWTEDILFWEFYNSTPIQVPADTVVLTYQCTVEETGFHQVTMNDAIGFNDSFSEIATDLVLDPVIAHDYQDGVCTVCGSADPNYVKPVTSPSISLKYPTLTFEDVILMNVYFSATDLDDVVEMGLVTYTSSVTSADVNTANAVIPGYTWSEADGLYCATTGGIAAKDLGDELYFAVYAKLADGTYYYTKVVSYSPSKYAYSSLSTGAASMKPIVVAMLNYGAAAQTYFDYKTDSLVNANLTTEQKALVESYRDDMIAAVTAATAEKQGTLVSNGGFSRRYPTVSFEGAFCINYYCVPSAQPVGGITMYYWDQAAFDANSVLTTENATDAIPMVLGETGEYCAVVEGIAAKDLDKGVYVAFVYSDGTTTYSSGVLAYSIGTYCSVQAAGTGTTAELAKATAVYGYYANELFNK